MKFNVTSSDKKDKTEYTLMTFDLVNGTSAVVETERNAKFKVTDTSNSLYCIRSTAPASWHLKVEVIVDGDKVLTTYLEFVASA